VHMDVDATFKRSLDETQGMYSIPCESSDLFSHL
jgi:hypothetical protein